MEHNFLLLFFFIHSRFFCILVIRRGVESIRVRKRRSRKFLESGEVFARLTGQSSFCSFFQ
jgi:hypothetical protein